MIIPDLWKLSHPDAPNAANYGTLANCIEWRNRRPILGREPESYILERMPCCQCCGADFSSRVGSIAEFSNGQVRCDRHLGRNPCIVHGCHRTCAAPKDGRLSSDSWICSEHWKRYVPPRSPMRRTYHRFFRIAKRQGWTPKLERRFWRFWDAMVKRVRRRAETGHIDQSEIERLFGWDEDG